MGRSAWVIVVLSGAFGCGANEPSRADSAAAEAPSTTATSRAASPPSSSEPAVVGSALAVVGPELAVVGPELASASASAPARDGDAQGAPCRVSYRCAMSHPGMGSWSDDISLELGTCIKTSTTTSGPWGDGSPETPTTKKTASAQLDKTRCARIGALAAAVTDAERSTQESAKMDTAACSLSYACGEKLRFSVQRQTDSGKDHVAELIRALRAAN